MNLNTIVYAGSFIIIFLALFVTRWNFVNLKNHDEGTPEMASLAKIIRDGADAFLKREYRVIIPTVVFLAALYSLFVERFAGLALIFGSFLNTLAVVIGMRAGTYANVRTANAARVTKARSRTVRIGLLGGSPSGFSVGSFSLLGLLIIWIASGEAQSGLVGHGLLGLNTCNPLSMRLGCFSLGYSIVGMFKRVAGGNFTKSGDVSSDIVGKNVHNLPEDDSRMPNTIVDFIGDNVNDVAGNVADLGESFLATPIASILIAMQVFGDNPRALSAACIFPFILASGGLLSSIIGVSSVIFANRKRTKIGADGEEIVFSREISDPAIELDIATYTSAAMVFIIGLVGAFFVFGNEPELAVFNFKYGWITPWLCSVLGIISSVAVGKITEYYTSAKYAPVKRLIAMAFEGDSFVVTEGDAIGYRSTLAPVLLIGISMIISYRLSGTYGIAIAGLGMLSFVGTTVSIDAFGPIVDNAGGIATSCHLDPEVRQITDQLDAVGNTTAAIGKGNAIGSAAFATVSLIMAYIESYNTGDVSLNSVIVYLVVGVIIGVVLVMYFGALLTDNGIVGTQQLADAGEAQLRIPGVLEGTVTPDYKSIVELASDNAIGHMFVPTMIALLSPPMFGFAFGPNLVLGILIGSTGAAVGLAIYNGNSGGAFDNAKKAIEMERALNPDDTRLVSAHKAAVTGDTTGDFRKDLVGVSLDIFIKIMATEANILAPLFLSFHLF